jgi:hypothetical protein
MFVSHVVASALTTPAATRPTGWSSTHSARTRGRTPSQAAVAHPAQHRPPPPPSSHSWCRAHCIHADGATLGVRTRRQSCAWQRPSDGRRLCLLRMRRHSARICICANGHSLYQSSQPDKGAHAGGDRRAALGLHPILLLGFEHCGRRDANTPQTRQSPFGANACCEVPVSHQGALLCTTAIRRNASALPAVSSIPPG